MHSISSHHIQLHLLPSRTYSRRRLKRIVVIIDILAQNTRAPRRAACSRPRPRRGNTAAGARLRRNEVERRLRLFRLRGGSGARGLPRPGCGGPESGGRRGWGWRGSSRSTVARRR